MKVKIFKIKMHSVESMYILASLYYKHIQKLNYYTTIASE